MQHQALEMYTPFGGINLSVGGRGGIKYAMKEMSNLKTVLI